MDFFNVVRSPGFAEMCEQQRKHENIWCDKCQYPIRGGNRWKCTVCADYDLCDECISTPWRLVHLHEFRKIEDSRKEKA